MTTYNGDTVFTGDIVVTSADVIAATNTKHVASDIDAQIPAATSTIEIVTGAFMHQADRVVPMWATDAAWLKRAVIYQVIWELEHPDMLSEMTVSNISQDGVSASLPDAMVQVLAPLARRAIKQCTWSKSGTTRLQSPFRIYTQVDATVSDNHGGWHTL